MNYKVSWEGEFEAESELEAALMALKVLQGAALHSSETLQVEWESPCAARIKVVDIGRTHEL